MEILSVCRKCVKCKLWLLLCLPVFTTSLPVWSDNRESHLDLTFYKILYLRKLSAERFSFVQSIKRFCIFYCLLSLTMQKFITLAAALHSFIPFLTTHSRLVVLLHLLARTEWDNKQAQGTSAHLNHPSKKVCLGAKPATWATLLVQLRGCTEERSCESPKELFAILIWTNLDWNQTLSSEAGRDVCASTHAQKK